jgi:hypothetical protein
LDPAARGLLLVAWLLAVARMLPYPDPLPLLLPGPASTDASLKAVTAVTFLVTPSKTKV